MQKETDRILYFTSTGNCEYVAARLADALGDRMAPIDERTEVALSAGECPDGVIRIREGRPAWVRDACTLCLHCVHTCPTFAIRYGRGDATRRHGQYRHPPYQKK